VTDPAAILPRGARKTPTVELISSHVVAESLCERGNLMNGKSRLAVVAAAGIAWLALPGAASASVAAPGRPADNAPVTCFIQARDGHYLTAVGGGGRTTDVLHTDAVKPRTWERFTLVDSGDGSSNIHYGFRTYNGHYLTAVGGGGRTTDVIHSDATKLRSWEKLSVESYGNGIYAIQTINGHYLTAVDSGGRTTDVIHSDAVRVGAWEKFRFTCGV